MPTEEVKGFVELVESEKSSCSRDAKVLQHGGEVSAAAAQFRRG